MKKAASLCSRTGRFMAWVGNPSSTIERASVQKYPSTGR